MLAWLPVGVALISEFKEYWMFRNLMFKILDINGAWMFKGPGVFPQDLWDSGRRLVCR